MSIFSDLWWINWLSLFSYLPVHLPLKSFGNDGDGKSMGFNWWHSLIASSNAISMFEAHFAIASWEVQLF